MGLRIANNIAAMNTHRWLGVADKGLSASLERLSSGYRINKAADDTAGLAISSKFRASIASFKVASRNTTEASSMLQVAEGGLDQINNMLTRLNELATQAASDNVGSSDRTKINSEADALINEINRIANSAKYSSTNLLNGTFGGVDVTKATTTDSPTTNVVQYATLADTILASERTIYDDGRLYAYSDAGSANATATISVGSNSQYIADGTWSLNQNGTASGIEMVNSGGTITLSASLQTTSTTAALVFSDVGISLNFSGQVTVTTAMVGADSVIIDKTGLDNSSWSVDSDAVTGTYTLTEGSGNITLTNASGTTMSFASQADGAKTLDFSTIGITLTLTSNFDSSETNLNNVTFTVSSSNQQTFQIGNENDANNQLSVSIGDSTTGTSGLAISTLKLNTKANAQTALDTIDTALSTLSTRRGDIGAYMNRLSYAAANLASTIENTQAAESVIRDVDMAMEMTSFTKNQILLQAGTAMLAQANMAPQQVLALFG